MQYDTNGDGTGPDYDFYMPSGKGVYLGVISAIPDAGKVNAIASMNLRPAHYAALGFAPPDDPGPRSETDLVDDDPALPDALEVAAQLDAEFRATKTLRPLHCIPMVIKDQMETIDLRTTDGSITAFANDRPPNDGTLVAKLRAAGAIIIAKGLMDEYAAGGNRSSYAGHFCNPYATDRDTGGSSTGSATAPSTNLAVCGIAEESGGSIREPGKKAHVVAMAATRGLVSRFGTWSAELIRERYGPECRTVEDLARILDVIRGYDAKDPITATQVGYTPEAPLYEFAQEKSLAGKRIGIIREFMPRITVNDADSIRVFNEEVIPTLRAAGAELRGVDQPARHRHGLGHRRPEHPEHEHPGGRRGDDPDARARLRQPVQPTGAQHDDGTAAEQLARGLRSRAGAVSGRAPTSSRRASRCSTASRRFPTRSISGSSTTGRPARSTRDAMAWTRCWRAETTPA